MKLKIFLAIVGASIIACATGAAEKQSDASRSWPQWRGPLATGFAPDADPPTEWSEEKNVKWKVKIPGAGSSTPAVWGDKVFVLTASSAGKKSENKTIPVPTSAAPDGSGATAETTAPAESPRNANPPSAQGGSRRGGRREAPSEAWQFILLCIDRNTGKTLWQKVAREEVPHEGHQSNNTYASASPITDGKLVYAFFGSHGLYCYDMDGNLKWSKDFGKMKTRNGFGEGASPVLHGDTLVVNWDEETQHGFITALDAKTGKEIWKTPRNESTGWSTPLIVEHDKKAEVVVNATGKVRSYNLADGKELWSCGGQTANAIPSPVADTNTVYVTSGFRGATLLAISLGRTGDLTGSDAIRWSYNKNAPYVPSPLLVDNLLYNIKVNDAMISCVDTKSGTALFEAQRLDGLFSIYASPVAAKDRVYVLGRTGVCAVLKKGPKFEVLATNKLNDKTDASPAIAGKEIFIRGMQNLYCIAEK